MFEIFTFVYDGINILYHKILFSSKFTQCAWSYSCNIIINPAATHQNKYFNPYLA